VAARMGAHGDLNRVVAMTSVNSDALGVNGDEDNGKESLLRFEPSAR